MSHTFPVAIAGREMAFNQDMKALVTSDDFLSKYIFYWFQEKSHNILHLTSDSSHGTKRIPTEDLFMMSVPLVSVDEQKKVVKLLEISDKSYKDILLNIEAELLRCLQELDPTADRAALRQQLRNHLLVPVAAPAAPAPAAPSHATEPRPAAPPVVALPASHGTEAGAIAQPAETGAPEPAQLEPALASDTLDDPEAQALWAAWQAGEPLDQLLIARCGYARGKAAEHTKDGIYRTVVPQILRTLRAEALVPALLAGVELAGEQVEQYEQVLRLLARIDRPVTGVLRTQMHNRLVQVLQQQLQEA